MSLAIPDNVFSWDFRRQQFDSNKSGVAICGFTNMLLGAIALDPEYVEQDLNVTLNW